jgi:hypothetical protein
MRQTYVNIPSESAENAQALMWTGIFILTVGFLDLTKIVAAIELPLHLIAAGLSFFALGSFIWWFRLRAAITDEGIYFVPKLYHPSKNFSWSEITQLHWHRYSYTDSDGGKQRGEEIVLTLHDGKTLTLDWPYCGQAVVQALERHLSPSPPQEESNT